MARPRVICHMATSIDGRIVIDGWPAAAAADVRREYELVHASYESEAWLCGRVTMEPFARGARTDDEVAHEHEGDALREDFVASGDHRSFAFALDPHGRLAWSSSDIDGDHVVAILTHRVSDDYLAFLRERGVSYLLCGTRDVDLVEALDRIGALFPVRTLMLEGGGSINGALLQAGLVDEVSVLVAPVADGRVATPSLFDAEGTRPWALILEHLERRMGNIVWLRYRIERIGL